MEQNLSQYKIFYEVAKAGNISKAAKELYISQPAISKAISKLEDSLGISLFTRNSRGVSLTDEGSLLFQHAKAAFETLSRGEYELKQIRDLNIGQIRIGVSNTLCKHILLPYLKGFIEQFPHIKINIECQSSTHTLAMLEQQHIDIGLVAEPHNRKNIVFIPIMEIEDIFTATPSYLENLRLREGKDCDPLKKGNLMLLDRDNITRRHVDDYLLQHDIEPSQVLEVTAMDLLIEFARIGLGIGCVIQEMITEDLESGLLVKLPLKEPIRKRTIGFAYHAYAHSRALTTFLDFCGSVQEQDPKKGLVSPAQ